MTAVAKMRFVDAGFAELERAVAKLLSDPEKAAVIGRCFKENQSFLSSVWPEFASPAFAHWFVQSSKVLGSLALDHHAFILQTLPEDLLKRFTSAGYEKRDVALDVFFKSMQRAWGGAIRASMVKELVDRTVVILFRTCGRGHVSAAEGIKEFLDGKGYRVHLVDGGKLEAPKVYTPASLERLSGMQELRRSIKSYHPSLLINTVAHCRGWTQLGYDLAVRTLVVHTDFVLQAVDAMDNPLLIQHCLPHEDEVIGPSTRVKEMGFPLRAPFRREEDPETIALLRSKYDVGDEEQVLLMIGHRLSDDSTIKCLIEKIQKAAETFVSPLCIIAICDEKFGFASSVNVRVRIVGAVTAEQMADYMTLASRVGPLPGLMVSKSGGSTTAESVEMGGYMICLPGGSGIEEYNTAYQVRHGLGEPYREEGFVAQVAAALRWRGAPADVYRSPLDWRANLTALTKM